jgi:hypothetical protein
MQLAHLYRTNIYIYILYLTFIAAIFFISYSHVYWYYSRPPGPRPCTLSSFNPSHLCSFALRKSNQPHRPIVAVSDFILRIINQTHRIRLSVRLHVESRSSRIAPVVRLPASVGTDDVPVTIQLISPKS